MTTPPDRVLLTVSGTIPADLDAQIASGRRPRADYRVIAEELDADVVDVAAAVAAHGRTGRVLARLGAGVLLAWYCFRRRHDYDVLLSDGEQVGLPYALLCRVAGRGRARHVMIVHILSVPKKSMLVRGTRIARLIDRYVVYCGAQRDHIVHRFGVDPRRIVLTPFMVDSAFFRPDATGVERRRMICSAGLERRDYATLMRAVDGLDVEVVIAAASPWSKRSDSTADQPIPGNVTISRLDLSELRDLYAAARFVVMPLDDVDFQAGITTILEAMSMARPVVCTRTPGQVDTIEDGVTGVYVPIGDADAMRTAILALLDDDERTDAMARAAREWVVANADVGRYADVLATTVRACSSALEL